MTTKNTVTQKQIDDLLDSAEKTEVILWGKELIVSYKLKCGFTVIGKGACVDPANFDLEVGRKVARQQAENKLWELEGYRLQWRLYEWHDLSQLAKELK